MMQLSSLQGSHVGETGVVLGNGPSLNQTNLASLNDVPTFGLNRIYLKSNAMGFQPTYHVCVNDLVFRQCANEIMKLGSHRFCHLGAQRYIVPSMKGEFTYLHCAPGPFFATDPTRTGIWQGATVTYVAMQLAYFLGFSRLLLVGVDHRFHTQGPAHRAVISRGDDRNHFDPNYFGTGFMWQLPDLETSELAYSLAKKAFESDGREIVDCTIGGELAIFRKSALEDELP